jgi:hypothetical protein
MPLTPPRRYRVVMPDGRIHRIAAYGPSEPAAYWPDAVRIERTDVPQPADIIEDEEPAS